MTDFDAALERVLSEPAKPGTPEVWRGRAAASTMVERR